MTRRALIRASKSEAGFSTVGALVSMVLSGLVLAQMLGLVVDSQRGFVKSSATASAATSARHVHQALTRLIRFAGADPHGIDVIAIDPDPMNHGVFDNVRIRSDCNPADGATDDSGEDLTFWVSGDTLLVKWGAAASPEPYLFGVDSLAFEYFDRMGVAITDPNLVTTSAASVRLTYADKQCALGGGPNVDALIMCYDAPDSWSPEATDMLDMNEVNNSSIVTYDCSGPRRAPQVTAWWE